MIISTVKYRETFFPKLDLTRILGIHTYDALHQMQLELKTNAISIQSNLGVPLTEISNFLWKTPSTPHCQMSRTYVQCTPVS